LGRCFDKAGRELSLFGKPLPDKSKQRPKRPKPPKPPCTRKEVDAQQKSTRQKLTALCRRISHDEASALLKKRGLKPEWLLEREASEGVFVHDGALELGALRLDEGAGFLGADALIVDGDLEVELIENGEQDFGPFLVVLGTLTVGNAALGGANVEVTGDLHVGGAFHGFYNHGQTHVRGDADVALLIVDDYAFRCAGTIEGAVVDERDILKSKRLRGKVTFEEAIHPAFLAHDEDGDVGLDSDAVYRQLVLGGAVTK
jgi:hypothetical protein